MFTPLSRFSTENKEGHSAAAKLEGGLLISKSTFPYFMLVAFEAGGPLRALILLLISPLVCLLEWFCHDKIALQLMVFVSLSGLKEGDVTAVAKSVLPRFYLEDIRASAFKVFSCCGGRKYVVTCMPRIMVEYFLVDYLNADCVTGADLRFFGGYCLGIVVKAEEMGSSVSLSNTKSIYVGVEGELGDNLIMSSCQESYIVPSGDEAQLPRDDYPKPLIFHDGRLVARPTPLCSLAIFLWLPLGIILAILRAQIALLLPYKLQALAAAATGVKTCLKVPPNRNAWAPVSHPPYSSSRCVMCDPCIHKKSKYTLYACSHRTLLDPLVIAAALERPLTAVTYSISKFSELLAPIRPIRLSRDRVKDKEVMNELLKEGDLVVCPEGTTCREPYLLRFSPLFAEIADEIVPVALETKSNMFYGTTVRRYKWLDSFFFVMNPNPEYKVQFLEMVSGGG